MSAHTVSAALLVFAFSAGGALAGDRSRMPANPQAETTGSVGRLSEPFGLFEAPPYDPRDLGPRAAGRSGFNPDTARARHYAR